MPHHGGAPYGRLERPADFTGRRKGPTGHGLAKTTDHLGSQEIVFHEGFHIFAFPFTTIAKASRNFLLELVGQGVLVASRGNMQIGPQRKQELQSLLDSAQLSPAEQILPDELWIRFNSIKDMADPASYVKVSESAWSFLNVGFKLVDGLIKSLVSFILSCQENFEKFLSVFCQKTLQFFSFEL